MKEDTNEYLDRMLEGEDLDYESSLGSFDDVEIGGAVGLGHVVTPAKAQPVNKATMLCQRGPCLHLWSITARRMGPGDEPRIRLQRIRQCNCFVGEETPLGDATIYDCDQWWPRWLAWVPESARGVLRPKLKLAWDKWLSTTGYDFSWKWWPDNIFETDDPELRKKASPGDAVVSSAGVGGAFPSEEGGVM